MVQDERSPTGTTSEWPAKQKCLPPLLADAGIEVGDVVGAGLGEIHALAAEAEGASMRSSRCSAPASRGVTLSQRTSARVSSTSR